ncbi:MAG: hypothetical protein GY841_04195 [FCB group bacterium]|nr:hypothetical protein [FCB group bacterium]
MLRERVFHPLVIGLFSVLFFHFTIARYLDLTALALHLTVVLIVTTLLTLLLGHLLRDRYKAALITSINIVLFIIYASIVTTLPDFYLVLEESQIAPNLLIFPVWLYLLYFSITRLMTTSKDLIPLTKILGWVGLVLLAGQLAFGGFALAGGSYHSSCVETPGDVNHDGRVNVGDVVDLIKYVFKNGAAPLCPEEANCNGDESINVGDVVFLINHVFRNGETPRTSPPLPGDQAASSPENDRLLPEERV